MEWINEIEESKKLSKSCVSCLHLFSVSYEKD